MVASEIRQWLVNRLSEVLELPSDRLNGTTAFDQLGLDSMSRVALTVELEQFVGKRIRPEDAARYDTIQDLAEYLATLPA